MTDSSQQPWSTDAVLGGTVSPPIQGAVLGGLANLSHRLATGTIRDQVAALAEARSSGPTGQRLVGQLEPQFSPPLRTALSFLSHYGARHPVFQRLLESEEMAFEGVMVNERGAIQRQQSGRALAVVTHLGQSGTLEMVAIPGGQFLMGSPDHELERTSSEGPQRLVLLPPFYIGRYPVTQGQWRAVAALPAVNLGLPSAPSSFQGEHRPVETINWYQAVEFCDRLSRHTGQPYHLPQEAQWEYACRAGTSTPFPWGETITTDLANYHGRYCYGQGPLGSYREGTTAVSLFPANGFGLHDMNGNVLEWCLDPWQEHYGGAPIEGLGRQSPSEFRVLRGGSWLSSPGTCRSAYRDGNYVLPHLAFSNVGLRVVCSSP